MFPAMQDHGNVTVKLTFGAQWEMHIPLKKAQNSNLQKLLHHLVEKSDKPQVSYYAVSDRSQGEFGFKIRPQTNPIGYVHLNLPDTPDKRLDKLVQRIAKTKKLRLIHKGEFRDASAESATSSLDQLG
jgi:hypothetical protein